MSSVDLAAKQWMQSYIRVVLTGSLLLLTGCQQDISDLEQYVAEIKQRPPAGIDPVPAIKPYVRYVYPAHGLDPFDVASIYKRDAQAAEMMVATVNIKRPPEFLERFALDSLKMVGTVFRDNELWALIQVPEGAVHRVRKGNYLGSNHGRIVSIQEAKIELEELVDNGFGGFKEQSNALALFDPDDNQG